MFADNFKFKCPDSHELTLNEISLYVPEKDMARLIKINARKSTDYVSCPSCDTLAWTDKTSCFTELQCDT
jgi:hypothetical protein